MEEPRVEVAACNGASTCLTAEERGGIVYIKNTENTSTVVLATIAEFATFLEFAKRGEFDALIQRSAEGAQVGELPETLTAVS